MTASQTNIPNIDKEIDVNSPEFYEDVHAVIETDTARIKKTVEVMLNLRLAAAEIEVETAALFHAELWYDLLNACNASEENLEAEDVDAHSAENNAENIDYYE